MRSSVLSGSGRSSGKDSSNRRDGSKSQFARGKEEARPTRFPNKNKSEVMTAATPTKPAASVAVVVPPAKTLKVPSIKLENARLRFTEWSPGNDGIQVILPSSSAASTDETLSSRDEVDAYITSVLYGVCGTPRVKRLLEFAEIWSEWKSILLTKPAPSFKKIR